MFPKLWTSADLSVLFIWYPTIHISAPPIMVLLSQADLNDSKKLIIRI